MITRTAHWDYQRRPKQPSPEMAAIERAAVEWLLDLYRWYDRGLITLSEFQRLAAEGPTK